MLTITILLLTLCSTPPAIATYNETFIKHMTKLLDGLLDNYDKKLRPGQSGSVDHKCGFAQRNCISDGPLKIYMSISIRSFGLISERNMVGKCCFAIALNGITFVGVLVQLLFSPTLDR
jgi:hypothetical protein